MLNSSLEIVPWFYLDEVPLFTTKAASIGKFSSVLVELQKMELTAPCPRKMKVPHSPWGNKDKGELGHRLSTFSFLEVKTSYEMKSDPIYVRGNGADEGSVDGGRGLH